MAQTSSRPLSTLPLQVVVDNSGSKPPKTSYTTRFGGGSGGGRTTVDVETKRFVDAKMESVKAQNDARFAEVLSRVDLVSYKIDHAPKPLTLNQLVVVGLTGIVALVGIFLAIVTFASDRFDGGFAASGVVDSVMDVQRQRDADQDANLNQFIDAVNQMQAPTSEP